MLLYLLYLTFQNLLKLNVMLSGVGIGTVLMQGGRPTTYFSEKLSGAALNLLHPRFLVDRCNYRASSKTLRFCIIRGFDNEMYDIID